MFPEARISILVRSDRTLLREVEAGAQAELGSVNGQVEHVQCDAVWHRRGPKTGPWS